MNHELVLNSLMPLPSASVRRNMPICQSKTVWRRNRGLCRRVCVLLFLYIQEVERDVSKQERNNKQNKRRCVHFEESQTESMFDREIC